MKTSDSSHHPVCRDRMKCKMEVTIDLWSIRRVDEQYNPRGWATVNQSINKTPNKTSQGWRFGPLLPVLVRLRQKDHYDFWVNLCCLVRHCLKPSKQEPVIWLSR